MCTVDHGLGSPVANRSEHTSAESFLDFSKFPVSHTKPVLSYRSEIPSMQAGTETRQNAISGRVQSVRPQWLPVLSNTASCWSEVRGDVDNDP